MAGIQGMTRDERLALQRRETARKCAQYWQRLPYVPQREPNEAEKQAYQLGRTDGLSGEKTQEELVTCRKRAQFILQDVHNLAWDSRVHVAFLKGYCHGVTRYRQNLDNERWLSEWRKEHPNDFLA